MFRYKLITIFIVFFAFFLSGEIYPQEEKNIDEIINDLKRLAIESPSDTALYFSLGDAYGKKGLLETAYGEYEKVWLMNKENVDALIRMGIVSLRRENWNDAEDRLNNAFKLINGMEELHFMRGLQYEFNLRYKEAINEYSEAIKKSNNLREINKYLGILAGQKGMTELGVQYYQKTDKLRFFVFDVYLHLGEVCRKMGLIDKSINSFLKGIEIKPNDSSIYFNLGLSYSFVDSLLEDAVKAFGKSISIDSTNADVHYNLAIVYGRLGNLGHSIWELQKVVKLKPGYAQAHLELGIAYFNNKQYLSAWEEIEETEKLGYKIPEEFIKLLSNVLPRPKK